MGRMFWIKIHKVGKDVVVAICDEDLLGKEIKDREVEIKIKKEFYGKKKVGEEEVIESLREMTIGNFFGNKIVKLLIEKKVIDKKNVMKVGGILHAQYIKL
ncbi:MAG: DUF424 family protein [Candidatus Aenigmarchaeota archaeon]|nr:DUF424 family protein [Candidatus Aenigmarchaeota archaeon]